MALNLEERTLVEALKKSGKSTSDIFRIVAKRRAGESTDLPDPTKPDTEAPSGFMAAVKDIPSDISEAFSSSVKAVDQGFDTAEVARDQVTRGEISPASGTAKTIGGGFRAGAEVVGNALLSLGKWFTSPRTEQRVTVGVEAGAEAIAQDPNVQTLIQKYESLSPQQKATIDGFLGTAEGLSTMFGAGPAVRAFRTGVSTVSTAAKDAASTAVREGLSQANQAADDAFKAATDLRTRAQVAVASNTVNPQLKASAERLFLGGTQRLENPLATYDRYFEQSKKALTDIKADPAIAEVGNKMGDEFNKVIQQRRAVGAVMGEELKKVGTIKTNIIDTYTNLETSLNDAGLRYNAQTKKLIAGKTSKMTKEDISLLEAYIKDLNKLGAEPTIAQIDAHIARTVGLVNNFKSARAIVETTNAERLIKASQSKLREQFDPKKSGNKALEKYASARTAYSELSDFIDDGASYLGKLTQFGDFAKDASVAKSAVQSVLNNGKKDWMIKLEALTGYPAIDEAVLALQAMKDAGDFRGLSLLQAMSEGAVPTSKAGFTQKVIDFAIDKGTRAVAGTPEEQTRAFLVDLLKQSSQ